MRINTPAATASIPSSLTANSGFSMERMLAERQSMSIVLSGSEDSLTITGTTQSLYRESLRVTGALPDTTPQVESTTTADQRLEQLKRGVSLLLRQLAGNTGNSAKSGGDVSHTVSVENTLFTSETTSLTLDTSAFSAENTADRIVRFALSFYDGGDRGEFAEMAMSAIEKGFEEARQALGGMLPEVSRRTYGLVEQAFDRFAAGDGVSLTG